MRRIIHLIFLFSLLFITNISAGLEEPPRSDFTGDGFVDFYDLWLMAGKWLEITEENLNMLGQLRSDVNDGRGFAESFGKYSAGEETLLIESEASVICYQLKEDEVARYRPADVEGVSDEEVTIWPIRHGKVKWQVWRKDGNGYAVEIQSYIEDKTSGHPQKKMANSYLYFAGSYKKARD